jgi:Ca-activated chloride channel family protein
MVVGPRYIPGGSPSGASGTGWSRDTDQVPDASRITPPVRHPASRPGHDIAISVRLDLGLKSGEISSPSHPIDVWTDDAGSTVVRLAERKALPNRDFVLEARPTTLDVAGTALFVSRPAEAEGGHFMLVAYPPAEPAPENRLPLERIFVIDVSGSMAGTSIEQAKAALHLALSRMVEADRFAIVAFNNSFSAFLPSPVPATASNLAAAHEFVAGLRANGGTEMLPALESAMAMPASEAHLRNIVLLTDGCLGNEEQVFASVKRNLGAGRLHVVAIGSAPNHFLAAKLAQYGRGTMTHITDASEVGSQMEALLGRIDRPVLADIDLDFGDLEVDDVFPKKMPDLFAREPLLVFGRITGSGEGSVTVSGTTGGGRQERELPVTLAHAPFHPGVTTLWARAKLDHLMETWRDARDEDEKGSARAAVVAIAIQHHLVTAFTSLVAVEQEIVNPDGDPESHAVPTEMPKGWKMDKVFATNPATGTSDLFLEGLGVLLLLLGGALLAPLLRGGQV